MDIRLQRISQDSQKEKIDKTLSFLIFQSLWRRREGEEVIGAEVAFERFAVDGSVEGGAEGEAGGGADWDGVG